MHQQGEASVPEAVRDDRRRARGGGGAKLTNNGEDMTSLRVMLQQIRSQASQ